jgi:hypothetical protein
MMLSLAQTDSSKPWTGLSVHFRHYPDGSIAATCRGKVGFGRNEDEALAELGRILHPVCSPPPSAILSTRQFLRSS